MLRGAPKFWRGRDKYIRPPGAQEKKKSATSSLFEHAATTAGVFFKVCLACLRPPLSYARHWGRLVAVSARGRTSFSLSFVHGQRALVCVASNEAKLPEP